MKLDELEIGQRFKFVVDLDAGAAPCVYAGESPCGRWFAYWVYDAHWRLWSIEEHTYGGEEVICE